MKARSAAGTPQRAAGTRTQGTATHRAPKQHPVSHPIHRRAKILPSLALIFCLAALTRFAAGVGTALAEGPDAPAERVAALAEDRPAAPNVPAGTPTASTARPVPAAVATDPVESAEMALSLARRERALQEREQALAEREQILASAEARIQQQITALQTAERELAATMALAERAAEDDILRLVNVFESMKADEAALVFAEMDPGFAAGFIGRLRPEAAAAIMAGLEPRQAYTLSTIVAGRNALVPRN
ncbi:MAG: MotE family protein [Pararhodobacter sp.]